MNLQFTLEYRFPGDAIFKALPGRIAIDPRTKLGEDWIKQMVQAEQALEKLLGADVVIGIEEHRAGTILYEGLPITLTQLDKILQEERENRKESA